MHIEELASEIIGGKRLKRQDDLSFFKTVDLEALATAANQIRKDCCGDGADLCSIINGRSGRCSEDCKFCAQSGRSHTGIEEYSFLDNETILADCKKHADRGIHKYSIVTAGRELKGEALEKICRAYKQMAASCTITLCASHGLLSEEGFLALKESGVTNYHENIETSKRNFPNICTTHTYDEKIHAIKLAQKTGLNVCSGGIIGMGETFEDRLDMAISLSELNISSIPLNVLIPIKGTPFEDLRPLTEDEIMRVIAMFRFINPVAFIRLGAGRNLMRNSGERAFVSGANATISGDLLTTSGNNMEQDKKMLVNLGFTI